MPIVAWNWPVLILSVTFCAASVDAQSGSCPLFGTDQSSLSRSTEERIFLNFEAPSQCRSNVTAWQFCYYDSRPGDDDDEDDQYGAKFMVYRRSDPTSDSYVPVPGSIMSQLLGSVEFSTFSCMTVNAASRFEIQENDVVGACVWDDGNVNPLYLIGDTNDNDANQKLYQYDRSGYEDCTSAQIGNVDTGHSDFRQRDEWKLHLYAITGMKFWWWFLLLMVALTLCY